MKIFLTAVAFVALTMGAGVQAAQGAEQQQRLDAMASLVAGHPVRVDCVTDPAAWLRGPAPQALGYQWAHEPGEIHLGPYACEALRVRTSPLLGAGLHILAHEAAHARGIDSETVASCFGLAWAMDLARRFYAIPFFSPLSRGVEAAGLSIHRMTPDEYRGQC